MISNVFLQLVIIVRKSIINIHSIYKNAKVTRREYETSNGDVDSSRAAVPNRGPSGLPGGHGKLRGATGAKLNFGKPCVIEGGRSPQHNM